MTLLALALVLTTASATPALNQTAQHAGTVRQMPPASAIEDQITIFQKEITSVAMAMPADRYSFSPANLQIPGATFGKVRTFAEQVAHVAQANYAIASSILGQEPTVDLSKVSRLTSKTDILKALAESFTEVHRAVATITVKNENDFVDDIGIGPNQSKISEAAWVATHGFDHYGQMVEYLRMNGIAPPALATLPAKAP